MDSTLVLIKIITLLYQESQIGEGNNGNRDYVLDLIETLPLPNDSIGNENMNSVHIALRRTIRWMCEAKVDEPIERTNLLQRLATDCGENGKLYDSLELGTVINSDAVQTKRQTLGLMRELRKWDGHRKLREAIKRLSAPIIYQSEDVDMDSAIASLLTEIESLNTGNVKDYSDPAVVAEMSVSQTDKVQDLFKQAKEESSDKGVLKTGWQGVNRLLGEVGGFRRGECIVVGALQHHNKSGFTMNLTRQICTLNVPYMRDPTKKPMIMHISAENNPTDNIVLWWKQIMANATGQDFNHAEVDEEEAARVVREEFSKMGYEFNFCRVNPSIFGYRNLFERIKYYESLGYEIHMLCIDYLNMFTKEGCERGVMGQETVDLFRRSRNFCSARGITFMTPHQLSPQAKQMLRQGQEEDLLKECVGKGYWDASSKVDHEVDVEILIQVLRVGDESYLCIQGGKHRTISVTPQKDKFCVYKFERGIGILDDIHGQDMSRRSYKHKPMGEGGAADWNGFDEDI